VWNNAWQLIDSVNGNIQTYLHTGLSCNVHKYYRVAALDNTGLYLSQSDTIKLTPFDTIKPPAPVIQYATVLNGTQIALYWNKSIPKVKEYELSMKTAHGAWTVIDTAKQATSYVFKNLDTPDSTYSFQVVAIDSCAANRSPNSLYHSPVQLGGTPLDDTVLLSWKPYEGFSTVKKYYIYNYQSGNWKLIDSVPGNITSYYHKTIPCNVNQFYRIGAMDNTNGYLSESDTIRLTPFDTVKPKAPLLKYATVLPNQSIKLSWQWDTKSDVKYFEIWKSTNNGVPALLDTAIYDSTYVDTQVSPASKLYSYHIIAIDSCNAINRSLPSHQDTLMQIKLHSFACTPLVDISWSAYKGLPYGPDTYDIYRSTDKVNFIVVASLKAPTFAYTDNTVSTLQVYYYKVRAIDSKSGNSSYSDTLGIRPVIVPHPDSTQFVFATVRKSSSTSGQIYLRWKSIASDTNAKGYHIYLFDSATGTYKLLVDVKDINATSYLHSGINTLNRGYRYFVTGYNRCGIEGAGSVVHSPVLLVSHNQNLQNKLIWTSYKGSGVQEYDLYKADNGGVPYLLKSFTASDTSYLDTNIYCGRNYAYQVRTKLANDSISFSDSSIIRAFDTVPPPQTKILVAMVVSTSKTSGQIQVSFPGNFTKNRSGFNIYRTSTIGKFAFVKYLDDTSSQLINWIDGGLNTVDSTYHYYVRAVDSCFNEAMPADTHTVVHLLAKAYNRYIKLDWSGYKGWTDWKYVVMKRQGNGAWYVLKVFGKDTLSFADSNVTCHKGYTYMIEALDASGGGLASYSNLSGDTAINTVPPSTSPIQVATVVKTGSAKGSVHISWNPSISENIEGYNLFRSQDGLYWLPVAKDLPSLSFLDSDLNTYGRPCYYKVQPVDSCGNLGSYTTIHKTINLHAQPGNQSVQLDWTAYQGWKVRKYMLYKNGAFVDSTSKGTLSYRDTLVLCDTVYKYLVKAVCDTTTDTLVSWSNTDSVRAYDHIAPQKVYIKTVTVSNPNKAVTITWSPSVSFDVKNYFIYKKSAATGEMKFIDSTANTSYTDTFRDVPGTDDKIHDADCYYIFARDHCNNQSAGSNPGCIMILNAQNQQGYNDLNWNGYNTWYDGIQSYNVYKNEDNTGWSLIGTTTNGNINSYTDKNLGDTTIEFCYQVEAIENAGKYNQMSRSTVACVHQNATVFIPNTFSHYLLDGLNDKFGPKGLYIKNYTMQVYNRWGELIYNTDKSGQWDGTFRGADVQEGVYVYTITVQDYNNHFSQFTGNITILK